MSNTATHKTFTSAVLFLVRKLGIGAGAPPLSLSVAGSEDSRTVHADHSRRGKISHVQDAEGLNEQHRDEPATNFAPTDDEDPEPKPKSDKHRVVWDTYLHHAPANIFSLARSLASQLPNLGLTEPANKLADLCDRFWQESHKFNRAFIIERPGDLTTHNDQRRWITSNLATAKQLLAEFDEVVANLPAEKLAPPLPEDQLKSPHEDGEEDGWYLEQFSIGGPLFDRNFHRFNTNASMMDSTQNFIIAEARASQSVMKSSITLAEVVFWGIIDGEA